MTKKLLSILVTIVMVISIAPVAVFAEEDIFSYLTYEIVDEEVTITDCDESISGDVVIPDAIEGYPVTTIRYDAFLYCEELTSITLPVGIIDIDLSSFDSCYSLKKFIVDKNNENYSTDENGVLFNKDKTELILYPAGCNKTEYVIPDSVNKIGYWAFHNCPSLKSITIPDNVTIIAGRAFEETSGLTKIIWNANNVSNINDETDIFFNAGSKTDSVDLIIGDNVEKIPDHCFEEANITSVFIPDSVTEIEKNAFADCRRLQNIDIPASVATVGAYTFYGCNSLEDIVIPDNVKTIGNYAFAYCDNLSSITIGNGVEKISSSVFRDCFNLENVTIGNTVESINVDAFYNCLSLKTINIPESVAYISTNVFADSGLEKIVINNKKCVIEYSASTIPETAVIYGHVNSPAQIYAQMYGRDFVPLASTECEHTYGEWIIDAESTCTDRGFAHRVCSLCNGYEFDVIEKTGHIDNDSDNVCDVCDDVISVQTPGTDDNDSEDTQKNGMLSFFYSIAEMFNKIIAWIKSLFGMV